MKTNPFGFSQSFTCCDAAAHKIYLLYVSVNTESPPPPKKKKKKANNSEKSEFPTKNKNVKSGRCSTRPVGFI